MPGKTPHLRSRLRRGRWFHTYRRQGKELSLEVHGMHPTDPRVLAAWARIHASFEKGIELDAKQSAPQSFRWGVELYLASPQWQELAKSTRVVHLASLRRYMKAQGDRPLASITRGALEAGLQQRGGFVAVRDLAALKRLFNHLHKLRVIAVNPADGLVIRGPKVKGFRTASAEDIERFKERWPTGTLERLIFDLALYTGAARADLVKLSRRNINGDLLSYRRQKTGTLAEVPMTAELRRVIAGTPDIAPAFLIGQKGKPISPNNLGVIFTAACREAGMESRLHGLRKAFCVYWAERGVSTHELAAMAGHSSLAEVERYTRAADRARMVKALASKA